MHFFFFLCSGIFNQIYTFTCFLNCENSLFLLFVLWIQDQIGSSFCHKKIYIYCFYDEFLTDISVNYENSKNLILKCIRTCLWHQLAPILGMVNCTSHCKETDKCKCMHNIYNWMGDEFIVCLTELLKNNTFINYV